MEMNRLLQHTLRSLCADSQWAYSIFWRILPRNYPPPKWDTRVGPFDRSNANKRNWILVWEDGFCDFVACWRDGMIESPQINDLVEEDTLTSTLQPELFFKMSHDVYNFGEGFMGKIAADNSHKWVYGKPPEHEIASLPFWQATLDAHPRTWEAQFCAGIQTIAIVTVGGGLLQLGSTKKISEDLNFVLTLQRKFHCLWSIPGVFAPHRTSDLLQARRNFRAGDKGDNGCMDEDGDWSFTSDRMLVVADILTGHGPGRTRTSLFRHDCQFRAENFPLAYDGTVHYRPCRGDFWAQSSTLQALNPIDRRQDELLRFEEPSVCFRKAPPVIPSMSSLQALLSKLPAVTGSDSPAIPFIPENTPSLMDRRLLGSYVNTSIPTISASIAQRTPQSSPPPAATSDSIGQPLLQSRAVRYAPSSTTAGAGNCKLGVQRSVAVSPPSIEADDWPYLESDGSQNVGPQVATHGDFSEFDELPAGDLTIPWSSGILY